MKKRYLINGRKYRYKKLTRKLISINSIKTMKTMKYKNNNILVMNFQSKPSIKFMTLIKEIYLLNKQKTNLEVKVKSLIEKEMTILSLIYSL